MVRKTVEEFMRQYIYDYILDSECVELLQLVSKLADSLFDFGMECTQEECERDEYLRLLYAYRDLAQYSIDCVLHRAEDGITWRKERIAEKEAEEKEL